MKALTLTLDTANLGLAQLFVLLEMLMDQVTNTHSDLTVIGVPTDEYLETCEAYTLRAAQIVKLTAEINERIAAVAPLSVPQNIMDAYVPTHLRGVFRDVSAIVNSLSTNDSFVDATYGEFSWEWVYATPERWHRKTTVAGFLASETSNMLFLNDLCMILLNKLGIEFDTTAERNDVLRWFKASPWIYFLEWVVERTGPAAEA
jgi:hypothetical protein